MRELHAAPPGTDLAEVLRRVRYVGSGEHKSYPSFAGAPAPRSDAALCDPQLSSADELTTWLRVAIGNGFYGEAWEGGFPKYVWFKAADGRVYESRLINQGLGEYKGYELTPGLDVIPEGLDG